MKYQLFKRSKGNYYLRIFNDANTELKRISTKQSTKALALKFLKEYEESLHNEKKTKELNCKAVYKYYKDYKQDRVSKSHLKNIEFAERKFIDAFGNSKIKELLPYKLESYLIKIFNESKYSATLQFRILRNFFNWSIDNNFLEINPLRKVKLPKIETKFPSFIDQSQLEIICTNTDLEIMKDIFRVLFYTGMRVSELINLQLIDIDFNEKILRVSNKEDFTTKSKKERIIPMNHIVFDILIKYRGNNINPLHYFFTKNKVRFNKDYISKSFKTVIRKLNLSEDLHLHSLRHSFCSNLVNKGINLYTVKELAGHQDLKTTQVYSHLQTDSLRQAINQL